MKRRQLSQMRREDFDDDHNARFDDDDEEKELRNGSNGPSLASAEALSSRPIKKPVSRLKKPSSQQNTSEEPVSTVSAKQNPFQAFSFASSNVSSAPAIEKTTTEKPNPFQGFSFAANSQSSSSTTKMPFTTTTSAPLTTAPATSATASSMFTFKPVAFGQVSSADKENASSKSIINDNNVDDEKYLTAIAGLNHSLAVFLGMLVKTPSEKALFADWSPLFKQYGKYLDDIRKQYAKETKPITSNITEKPSFSFGSSSEKKPEEGDKLGFTFNPSAPTFQPSAMPVFNIGSSDKDKHQPKETTMPSFSFGPSTAASKPAFATKAADETQPKTSSQVEEKTETAKPFSFTPSPFVPPTSVPETSKSFTLGNTSTPSRSDSETVPPVIPFGSAQMAESTKEREVTAVEAKPDFSFGTTASETGAKMAPAKPSFSFGSASDTAAKDTTNKPTFSFGSASDTAAKDTTNKPTFSFGSASELSTKDASEKPSFSFGSASSAPANPFSLNDSALKPSFSFGSTSTDSSASKPGFSFGSAADSSKPATGFSFGAAASAAAPVTPAKSGGFSFTPAPTSTPSTSTFSFTPAPATSTASTTGGFSFTPAPATSSTSTGAFGSGSFSFPQPTATTKQENEEDNENEGDEEAPKEERTVEQIELTKTGAGEEDETTTYEVRCKVYKMTNPIKDLGVGYLKINQSKTDVSVQRLIVRAEGTGKVTVNMSVKAVFQVTLSNSKKDVLLDVVEPVEGAEGETKPARYNIRVKTSDFASEFMQALEKARKEVGGDAK